MRFSCGDQLLQEPLRSIQLPLDLIDEQFALDEIQGFVNGCKVRLPLCQIPMPVWARSLDHGRRLPNLVRGCFGFVSL